MIVRVIVIILLSRPFEDDTNHPLATIAIKNVVLFHLTLYNKLASVILKRLYGPLYAHTMIYDVVL